MSLARSIASLLSGGGGALLPSNNLSDISNAATALSNLGGVSNTSQIAGNRNKIINGGMAIDQRNAGAVTTDGAFPADRFQSYNTGTGSCQRIAMSNPPEVSGFSHYLKFIRTGSGSSYSFISQKIENVKYLSGKQMTLSFYIKGDVINASGFTVWSEAWKDDGTFIAYGPNNGTPFTITSTWTRVSMRMDVPVISVDPGAVGGFFRIFLRCSSATENFNISTTGWQWEEGTVATPFENRLYGTELALCQRYYYKTAGNQYSFFGWGKGYTTGNGQFVLPLPVTMRVIPSLGYSALSDVFLETGATAVQSITGLAINGSVTTNSLGFDVSKTGAFTAGALYWLIANNLTTAYIAASAEL